MTASASNSRNYTKLEWALVNATAYDVFPLVPNGKTPALEGNWRKTATREPERIREMWTCPVTGAERDYNIGLALRADQVVVDVDVRDGKKGAQSLAAWEAEHGPLGDTYTIETASSGEHRHYTTRRNSGDLPKELAEHIDLKGFGGYVVGPGSEIDGRMYTPTRIRPPVAACEALEALADPARRERRATGGANGKSAPLVELDSDAAISRATEWLENYAPLAIQGDRGDDMTIKVTNRVIDFGVSADEAAGLMWEHWNDRCSPPWSFDDLLVKTHSAYKSRQNAPGVAAPEAEFEAVEVPDKPAPIAGEWDGPDDVWAEDPAAVELPNDSVPDVIADLAAYHAEHLGVDRGSVALSLLVGFGSLVPAGNRLNMRQNSDHWQVRPILWVALIGSPGTNKSATAAVGMQPARIVDAAWHAEYARAKRAYDLRHPPEPPRRGRKAKPKADDTVAADDPATEPAVPELTCTDDAFGGEPVAIDSADVEPVFRQKVTNDATTEALVSVLSNNHDGVLVFAEELTGLLGSMDAYRNRAGKDRPFWLQGKDGGPYTVNRKGGAQ